MAAVQVDQRGRVAGDPTGWSFFFFILLLLLLSLHSATLSPPSAPPGDQSGVPVCDGSESKEWKQFLLLVLVVLGQREKVLHCCGINGSCCGSFQRSFFLFSSEDNGGGAVKGLRGFQGEAALSSVSNSMGCWWRWNH